jgi:hypothetical protein
MLGKVDQERWTELDHTLRHAAVDRPGYVKTLSSKRSVQKQSEFLASTQIPGLPTNRTLVDLI